MGKTKKKEHMQQITDDDVWEMVKDINVEFAKGSRSGNGDSKWKKKSIFYFGTPILENTLYPT